MGPIRRSVRVNLQSGQNRRQVRKLYAVSEPRDLASSRMYAVEFQRYPGDLGVCILVNAEKRFHALKGAWKLYPECRERALAVSIYEVQYADLDWAGGRMFIKRQKARAVISKIERQSAPNRRESAEGDKQ